MAKKNETESRALRLVEAPDFIQKAVTTFEGVQQLADVMAKCGTMPDHLKGKREDCFRVVVQAAKWRMDPFAVAECTSLVHGRMCFEGKLVAAVLQSMGAIEGRLDYKIQGEGQGASITIAGTPRGAKESVSIHGSVHQWRTYTKDKRTGNNVPNAWDKDPESMLIYRGTRQWARVYAPEAILGVYTPDEFDREIKDAEDVEVAIPKPAAPPIVEAEVVEETDPIVSRDVVRPAKPAVAEEPETEPEPDPDPEPVKEIAKPQLLKAEAVQTARDWYQELRENPDIREKNGLAAAIVEQLSGVYGAKNPPGLAEKDCPDFLQAIEDLRVLSDPQDIQDAIAELAREREIF